MRAERFEFSPAYADPEAGPAHQNEQINEGKHRHDRPPIRAHTVGKRTAGRSTIIRADRRKGQRGRAPLGNCRPGPRTGPASLGALVAPPCPGR